MKKAVCTIAVPECLCPEGKRITEGDIVSYVRISSWNGEHHLVLEDKSTVPSIFFDV